MPVPQFAANAGIDVYGLHKLLFFDEFIFGVGDVNGTRAE